MNNTKLLKCYRKLNCLTQEEVARKIMIPKTTYASYEQGKADPPTDVLEALSRLYEITIDDLMTEKDFCTLKVDIEKYMDFKKFIDSASKSLSMFEKHTKVKDKEEETRQERRMSDSES